MSETTTSTFATLQDGLTDLDRDQYTTLLEIAKDEPDALDIVSTTLAGTDEQVAVLVYRGPFGITPLAVLANTAVFDRLDNPMARLTDAQVSRLALEAMFGDDLPVDLVFPEDEQEEVE